MPELPEVETIRRTLADKVSQRVIKKVELLLPRLIKWPGPGEFQAMITGKRIRQLTRRGKYLLFHLDENMVMVVHLRMTGRLYFQHKDEARDKYMRILFTLDNGDVLLYADTRTLGTLYLMEENELWRISGLQHLGPEPLTLEFSLVYFSAMLKKRPGKIKAVLLNQALVSGLGNIYVDESLAQAGIHPERRADCLLDKEIERLYYAVNQVIQAGIDNGGTSFRDYRDGAGRRGSHQEHLQVYGRQAQPCRICGTPIVKTVVAGRGTHYCPYCQQ
ncbi:Formamidopyrimidine-DNA glycosylase [Propionispora sp. 2/2-37]|uniref:DNA-formamidopyrimidine glycosylase n=1 Tax=Propionispora sp. 2/2-37 TaxID=1677858 RepID=UPI0006BB576F|nr:DNA-formamidopyrimidine glycosylase [Propionispora sp. 2/2-37]CUH95566.1 Formamidopyrimidine-DNA glycosylase [Propionispora sp. 2/2-37]